MRFWGRFGHCWWRVETVVTEVPSGPLVTVVSYKQSVLEPKKVHLLACMWRA